MHELHEKTSPLLDRVLRSARSGLSFLVATQESSGSWDTTCRVADEEPTRANGLFATSAVLLAVGHLLPDESVQRATDFIVSCRNESGHWCFDPMLGIPDDADDTACSLAALARFCPEATSPEDTRALLTYWREPAGPFRTWHPASDEQAEFWSFSSTDDAIVNCNVVFALSQLGFTPSPDMVNATVTLLRDMSESRYYCGSGPILHAAARVGLESDVHHDVRALRPTPAWSSLQLSNWLSARPMGAIDFVPTLIDVQAPDGGWPDDDWCTGNIVPPTVWGSRAASTAFALEAFDRIFSLDSSVSVDDA